MPQKMLTPFWWPIMLWIISVSSTVLPTPAPPNRPALPPRSSGVSTSMALMPVSKTSDCVERRTSGGGARCTERHVTPVRMPARRSMVLPNTSSMRDRIGLPTGACSGPPVSRTAMPRASPPVGVKAMPRTCVRVALCQDLDGHTVPVTRTEKRLRWPADRRRIACRRRFRAPRRRRRPLVLQVPGSRARALIRWMPQRQPQSRSPARRHAHDGGPHASRRRSCQSVQHARARLYGVVHTPCRSAMHRDQLKAGRRGAAGFQRHSRTSGRSCPCSRM